MIHSTTRFVRAASATLFLAAAARAQEPLFTFAQVSDSQPETPAHEQAFVDVLRTLAEAGQPGALLPRRVDLVFFAGDITWGNTLAEWESARAKLDTWLTANDIPYLAVPGNHDVNNSDTSLYEQFIGDAGVWDQESAAFTGQNGRSRTTHWRGLRFIGLNNSNPGWNTVSSADVADVRARVLAAQAAGENVFLLAHHPHDEKARMPLADVLPNPANLLYMHGHAGSPRITRGLAGVAHPDLWDFDSNAIYEDRGLIYVEVQPSELRAHVVVLDPPPSTLPAPTVIPLPRALTPLSEPDLGRAGAPHVLARAAPSGRSPERKLWHQAGHWFGVLWSDAAQAWRIQRLDPASDTWIDTGPSVSSAPDRSFDAWSAEGELYLASNVPTVPAAPGAGSPGQVARFHYDALDLGYDPVPGFPVAINDSRSATLALARDGAGLLWAAWTRAGSVLVNHGLTSDASTWDTPLVLASGLDAADGVAPVAFGGRVGVLWSDSPARTLSFAWHADGAPASQWTVEGVPLAAELVGGELDVTSADGSVLAVVRAPDGTLTLLQRSPGGAWSARTAAAAADGLSQPLLLVERAFGHLRLVATGPTGAGQSVDGGGAIYTKLAPLGTLVFPPGRGTALLQDGTRPSMGSATSTRQAVDGASDLVVLASNAQAARYWHVRDPLASAPLGPVAQFSAAPRTGEAPLLVTFTDLSSGAPSDWLWDFGDGSSSNEPRPQHVYAAPGTYAVALRVASGAGQDQLVRTAWISVAAPAPRLTFTPVADARVNEASPTSNAGNDVALRVKSQAGSSFQSYLKFDLRSLSGTVLSAKLRLFCSDTSNSGGSVFAVADDSWTEAGIKWSNRPPLGAGAGVLAGVTAGFWGEVDVTAAVTGPELLSLAVAGGSTNSAIYSSREGAHPPELVLTLAGTSAPPVASFEAAPLAGPAPLAVSFADTSTGLVTHRAWDFGDGATSSERNPTHVYSEPGTYTVQLEVSNPAGLDALTRLDCVAVAAPPPVRTFTPTGDARVYEASPTRNFGADPALRVKTQLGSSYASFLRFDLSGLGGSVLSAKLRLFCTDPAPAGVRLYVAPNTWSESGVTWNNRPALPPSALATLGPAVLGAWVEVDVGSAVTGPGPLALALAGGTTNSAYFSAREGAHPPELVVTTGELAPPVAEFAAAPTSGPAPLAVQFTDQSSDAVSWSWDFGDGTGSTLQHPSHVYALPGTYGVTLVAGNAVGTSTRTRPDLVQVAAQSVRTFLPVADARVNEANPGSNAGTDVALRVRQEVNGSYHTYLRFDLTSVTGPITSARLRLFATDGSNVAGIVFATSNAWGETTLNWTNKPAVVPTPITSTGTVANGAWAEFDLGSALTAGGVYSFALRSSSTNSCYYSSREGANPPELVITTGGP